MANEWFGAESLVKKFQFRVTPAGTISFDAGRGKWSYSVELAIANLYTVSLYYRSSGRIKILKSSKCVVSQAQPGSSVGLTKDTVFDRKTENFPIKWTFTFSHILTPSRLASNELSFHIDFCRSKLCECPDSMQKFQSMAFARLFETKDFADIVFRVGETDISAHKCVLVARYDYFKALLASGMEESVSNRVTLEEVDPDLFEEVLKFVYSGWAPDNLDSQAKEYLKIADRFGMEDLKMVCSLTLKKSLDGHNVTEILSLSAKFHCSELQSACLAQMKDCVCPDNVVEFLLLAAQYKCESLKDECFRKIKMYKKDGTVSRDSFEWLVDHPELLWETWNLV